MSRPETAQEKIDRLVERGLPVPDELFEQAQREAKNTLRILL